MKMKNRKLKIKTGIVIGIWIVANVGMIYINRPIPNLQNPKSKATTETTQQSESIVTPTKIEYEDKVAIDTGLEDDVPFFKITDAERQTLISIVAGEAEGESFKGKMAVAQCLLDSIDYEKNTVAGIRWKFDGYNPDLENTNPEVWAECEEAVSRVFDDGDTITHDLILWYYNPDVCYSGFHESQTYLMTIGSHRFFGIKNAE